MSNCSKNCWIDWNSAVLCFKQLFHIGHMGMNVCMTETSLIRHTLYTWNLVPAYTMYHVFPAGKKKRWPKKARHRTDFEGDRWPETGYYFLLALAAFGQISRLRLKRRLFGNKFAKFARLCCSLKKWQPSVKWLMSKFVWQPMEWVNHKTRICVGDDQPWRLLNSECPGMLLKGETTLSEASSRKSLSPFGWQYKKGIGMQNQNNGLQSAPTVIKSGVAFIRRQPIAWM